MFIDLNTVDDSGLPWAFLDEAQDVALIVPGSYIVAGSGSARSVALVVDVEDGIVHVKPVRGSVASNAHLLTRRMSV
jgi:hypothetical protein